MNTTGTPKGLNASDKIMDTHNFEASSVSSLVVEQQTEKANAIASHTENKTKPGGTDQQRNEKANKKPCEVEQQQQKQQHGRRGATSRIPSQRYFDHINTAFDEKNLTSIEVNNLKLYHRSNMAGVPFPLKLQILLKIAEELCFKHIISWLPHGRAFIIHRPLLFEKQIMNEFLAPTKFSSFKRQLNLYDFKRVTNGVDSGAYYHEMFLRRKPILAMKMTRRKIKGQIRVSTYVHKKPELYSMPFMGLLFDNVPCYGSSKEHNVDEGSFMIPTSKIRRNEAVHPNEREQQTKRSSMPSTVMVGGRVSTYKYLDTTRRGGVDQSRLFPYIQYGTGTMTSASCYNDLILSQEELYHPQLHYDTLLPSTPQQQSYYFVQNKNPMTLHMRNQQQPYQKVIDHGPRLLLPMRSQQH